MQEETPPFERYPVRNDEVIYTIAVGSPEATGERFNQFLTDSQTVGTQEYSDLTGMSWRFAILYRQRRVLCVEGIGDNVRARLHIFDMDGRNLSVEGNRVTNHAAQILSLLGLSLIHI